jgi:metal-responsive CopG/Arc/MetJ family transcriptional regulator
MQETITINLPQDIRSALDEVLREGSQSPNELVCEALRNYLFIRKFRQLREHMTSKAQTQGIYTDQDVFDRVS